MFAAPIEGILKDSWSSPRLVSLTTSRRLHTSGLTPAEHYAKLIDRKGRYGRLRHASSLHKTRALPRTCPPRISRSPCFVWSVEASAKLPFYYAYPNPFLCPSSLSDCNLWIRSSAGYSGAFGSSRKPGTDFDRYQMSGIVTA